MKKLKNYLKSGILLLGISLLLWNCEKENFIETETIEVSKSLITHKIVKLSDIPEVKNFLNTKIKSTLSNKTATLNQAIFDENYILEVIDTLNNTNYSFRFVLPNSSTGTFYNLIIGKTPTGELKTPYVLKYVCNEAYLEQYIANNFNFSYFKGTVSLHKYTDFFEQNYFSKTICPPELDQNGDPIPCDTQVVDGGGTGGSGVDVGGTGSGTTTSNGGGGSSCSWNVTTSGPCAEGGTAVHSPEACGAGTGVHYILTINCNMQKSSKTETTDCPPCPTPTGNAIGVNTISIESMRTTLKFSLNLNASQIDWVSKTENETEVANIYIFLENNKDFEDNYTTQAIKFAELGIDTYIDKSDFNLNDFGNFNQFIPDYEARMTQEEILIFNSMPIEYQTRYLYNAHLASEKAKELFPGIQINNNADAFRHAYFHGLNTHFINYDLSVQLGDAHETETPDAWILEKVMDIYNNEIGRNLSQNPAIIMNAYGALLVRVNDAIRNGDLVYLNPIDYNDPVLNNNPDFWDNQSTPIPNDGNHGIVASTIITPTR